MGRRNAIPTGPRRGGVLTSLTIVLALVAAGWFLWLLEADVEAAEFKRVDTRSTRVDVGVTWCDPRWNAAIQELVARHPPFESDDAESGLLVAQQLARLPFVLSVSPPETIWPDGVTIPLELRVPVACVQVGREFFPIAKDGVVLPGGWPAPPTCGGGFLPVLALDKVASQEIRPGQVVWNDAVADALSVACSLWAELEVEDLARLGRCLIDARKARRTDAQEPGTVIQLEEGRRILFGRAPSTTEPGELPVEKKWLHVANALLCLPSGPPLVPGGAPTALPGETDWELVEVRWDHAAMLPRGGKADATLPVKSVKTARPRPEPNARPKASSPSHADPAKPAGPRVH